MTIYLATASNPGMTRTYWVQNVKSIQYAFNTSSEKVKNWKQVTDNAWLVEAVVGVTAQEVTNIVAGGLRWKREGDSYRPVEATTVAIDGNPGLYTDRNADVKDWLKARELEAVKAATAVTVKPARSRAGSATSKAAPK